MAGRGRTCAERGGPVESLILVLDGGWWQIGKNLLHQSLDDMFDTVPNYQVSMTLRRCQEPVRRKRENPPAI